MIFRSVVLLLLLVPGVVLAQTKASEDDHVVLRNGKTLWGDIQIFKSAQTSQLYVVYKNHMRYGLGEIRSFSNNGAFFYSLNHLRKGGGITRLEPILLQRRIEGRVHVYSRLDEPPRPSDLLRYDYYSMGDDVPTVIKLKFLRQDLANNPPSMAALKRAGLFKGMGDALFTGGVLTALVGLEKSVTTAEDGLGNLRRRFTLSSTLVIGVGMAVSALLPYSLSKARVRKAIGHYNRR